MGILFSNNATAFTANAIGASDTVINIYRPEVDRFPTIRDSEDYFYLSLVKPGMKESSEVCRVVGYNRETLEMEVVRGVDDTTPEEFPAGSSVELRISAIALNDMLGIANEGLEEPRLQRFNFGLPSSEWVITHNKRTTLFEQTIWVQDEDEIYRQHLAPVELIDDNKFEIRFSHAVTGYVDVRF